MVKTTTCNVVLMSIHPMFAQLILDGKKKVEFRKTCFACQVSHIVIYATMPLKKVVGYFEVEGIQVASPSQLWKRYSKVAGIEHQFFQDYYDTSVNGVAIEIGRVYQLDKFLPLDGISESLVAPQSYIYLENKLFDLVKQNQTISYINPI